jgi:hypothetical protein
MEPPGPPPDDRAEGAWPPAEPELRCPRCNAQHEPGQEYCLECGLRLVPLPPVYRRMEVWSRDSPVWLWAALGALLLVALVAGAIVAAAAAGDDDDEGAPAATSQTGSSDLFPTGPATITLGPTTTGLTTDTTLTLPTTTEATTTFPTTTTLPTTTTTLPTTTLPSTTGPSGTIVWPSGTDGYTVILQSVPTAEGRDEADDTAQRAIRSGLPEVGVLDSSDYSSLNSGYWVVFTGVYDTLNEAENALPRARNAGYPLAYVRQVAD